MLPSQCSVSLLSPAYQALWCVLADAPVGAGAFEESVWEGEWEGGSPWVCAGWHLPSGHQPTSQASELLGPGVSALFQEEPEGFWSARGRDVS